jgi:thioredoxin 1
VTAIPRAGQRRFGAAALVSILLIAALGGNRLYMNIRPADPLPAGFVSYTPEVWAELQASGAPVLVDVYASWCPTCKAQHAILADLLADSRYRGVRGMRVDFDADREFRRVYDVQRQSTILMFVGAREVSRSVGLTSVQDIRAQVDAVVADAP